MKNERTYLGIKLEKAILENLEIGEIFYNVSKVKGRLLRIEIENGIKIAIINWIGRRDGSCFANDLVWKIK